ncbi:hypothetical protein Dimus_010281 [Dionaea muscipula]
MNRPGDWNCRSCNHLNFQRRESCQRCGEHRTGDRGDHYSSGFGGGGIGGRGGSSTFGGGGFGAGPDVRPGDWYCNVGNCSTHNFATRSSCFKCGAYKEESFGGGFDSDINMPRSRVFGGFGGAGGGSGSSSGRSGWKSGDWICTRSGCNEHNFASRMECFRCSAPRDLSSKSTY